MVRWGLSLMLALLLTGGHVAMLQVVAWTGMVVSRSQHEGWQGAVASTFDGRHPCAMCLAIQTMKPVDDHLTGPVRQQGGPANNLKQVQKSDFSVPEVTVVEDPSLVGAAIAYVDPLVLPAQSNPAPEPPPPQM